MKNLPKVIPFISVLLLFSACTSGQNNNNDQLGQELLDESFRKGEEAPFEILAYYFAKDADHVYYRAEDSYKILEGADTSSFEVINSNLAKDSDTVYLEWQNNKGTQVTILDYADPNTLLALSDWYAKDKNFLYGNPYFQGDELKTTFEIEKADLPTLEYVASNVFKDAFSVFVDGQIIPDVSPDDFKVQASCPPFFQDQENIYVIYYSAVEKL